MIDGVELLRLPQQCARSTGQYVDDCAKGRDVPATQAAKHFDLEVEYGDLLYSIILGIIAG